MYDKIEKLDHSLIQHGPCNKRIYLMKLDPDDLPGIIPKLEKLCARHKYTKIFAKIPESSRNIFQANGYVSEAAIPHFFQHHEAVYFMAKFRNPKRQNDPNQERIDEVLKVAKNKRAARQEPQLESDFRYRITTPEDAEEMVTIYKQVFKTYPFPIHDPVYLRQTMRENIEYFGIWHRQRLIALSSAEMDRAARNVEMTDFATLPEYRGHSLALFLLAQMEKAMLEKDIRTHFTIARAVSFGMNITFAKAGYHYSGTLINNTDIAGHLESMNVWYKVVE